MKIITQKYTILWKKQNISKTFTIKFDKASYPKDIHDHNDAVVDYLIDTNQNPFESIPTFAILTIHEVGAVGGHFMS